MKTHLAVRSKILGVPGVVGNNDGACRPSVVQINTIRPGGSAISPAGARFIVSNSGNASETPDAFRNVRRLSGWCIGYLFLNSSLCTTS